MVKLLVSAQPGELRSAWVEGGEPGQVEWMARLTGSWITREAEDYPTFRDLAAKVHVALGEGVVAVREAAP